MECAPEQSSASSLRRKWQPPFVAIVSIIEWARWPYSCCHVRRQPWRSRASPSSAEKCVDREQGAGDRTGVYLGASGVLVAILHRLVDSSMSESSERSPSLSADVLVLDELHSAADDLCVVHLAIVVLHGRMASDELVSLAEESHRQASARSYNEDEPGQRHSSTKINSIDNAAIRTKEIGRAHV